LLGILSFPSFAAAKDKHDFPLQVHIVSVDMAQGQRGVSGSGGPDFNGNYTSRVHGGGSYLYHVFTVHIDGSDVEYKMTIAYVSGQVLHLGVYKGGWNRDGSLEVQFLNEKGKLKHQRFSIEAESPLPSEQTSTDKQPHQ
jgi:hypothetical protein